MAIRGGPHDPRSLSISLNTSAGKTRHRMRRSTPTPRLVVHIDDAAIAGLRQYFGEVLQPGAAILNLMSSWRSHLPDDTQFPWVAGLGLNPVELAENPQLTQRVVHDLNFDSHLSFDDAEFYAVLLTVSVQYLVRPVEVFAEVGRVLRPGGQFSVSFSNRMFPTKAVHIWRASNDSQHLQLVMEYMGEAGCFGDAKSLSTSGPGKQ